MEEQKRKAMKATRKDNFLEDIIEDFEVTDETSKSTMSLREMLLGHYEAKQRGETIEDSNPKLGLPRTLSRKQGMQFILGG